MTAAEIYKQWCCDPIFDEETHAELMAIAGNEEEIEDRFCKDLEFGTGGLRGIMGAGSNRVNRYTIGKATQGLANYIIKEGAAAKGVAIAHDCRNNSAAFAMHTGLVLAANGIPAYVFESLRPTPELSFAVRELGCTAGVVITASHNPPAYNGYKVYWADGAQVTSPRDKAILAEVAAVSGYDAVRSLSLEEAKASGLYRTVGAELDEAYLKQVKAQSFLPQLNQECGHSLKVVYTPLHGTGCAPVCRLLPEVGFTAFYPVEEQCVADGNFPTVAYPNPEDPKAFAMALALAKEKDADIVLATDPDADRVGIVAKDKNGDYAFLSGNMSGALLTEYVLARRKEQGLLPENAAVIKTIVTTDMIDPIARAYGADVLRVLTGFKYIGEQMKRFEESGEHTYVFGFEESYGCLAGTYARDKDAIGACLLLCEVALYYKEQGLTLFEALDRLHETYGYYAESVRSLTLEGVAGMKKIAGIMSDLRTAAPMFHSPVVKTEDYKTGVFTDLNTGETEVSPLPVSDVLRYTLADNSWVCIRPSGTEPKLKFYCGLCAESEEAITQKKAEADRILDELLTKLAQ